MKAIRKEFRVELIKSFSRFISILLIVALGVAFYCGIRSTEPDMRLSGDQLYDKSNLLDLKIVSTMGLSQSDIDAIAGVKEIDHVIGSYSADVIAQTGKNENVLKFMSQTNGINDIVITAGEKPSGNNECVIDKTFMDSEKLKIGDLVKIKSAGQMRVDALLKETEYKIVGTFNSTQYMSSSNKGTSTVGNGRINGLAVVNEDAFKLESYTEVYVAVKGVKAFECYSDQYQDAVQAAKNAVKNTVMDTCIKAKYQELYNKSTDVITGVEKNIAAGKKVISKSQKVVKQSNKAIKAAGLQKDSVQQSINENQQKIDMFNNLIAQYAGVGFIPKGILNNYDVPIAQMERERDRYIQTKAPYDNVVDECNKVIEKAQKAIADANAMIAKTQKGLAELDLVLSDAIEAREGLTSPTWYLTDRGYIQTYVEYDDDAQRLGKIGIVFPIIFFLVATLVSLTTMTRMITEQRTQIGTLKALGYSKFTIAFKYVKYAMLATISGSIIGSIIGSKVFPVVILRAYRVLYPSLSTVVTPFNWEHDLTATAIAVICVLAATLFASYKTLLATASELMRPESPKIGKKILLERVSIIWNHLNFNAKSTIRNLVRYKKRFFMTLFGVSGCMALIIVGFGLKDSTAEISELQYGSLHKYDAKVEFNLNSNEKRIKEADTFIDKDDRVSEYLRIGESTIKVSNDNRDITGLIMVPMEESKIEEYIDLRERNSGKKLEFSKGEVVITEKLAKLLNVSVGDTIKLSIGETEKKEVKISAVTENYLFHYVYMSPELYQKTFNKDAVYNELLLRTNKDVDTAKLTEQLLELKAVNSVSFIKTLRSHIQDVLRSIDIIVAVLIISAGGLAFIVLYNLNNINIQERKRELATLKVLGFYDKEVMGYVYRENIIITILGVVLGCGFGAILHQFVIRTAEMDAIMFGRQVSLISYVYSALITIGFSILINFTMYFKLNKIDMAESMKTIE